MPTQIASQRVIVTGHNRESEGRVVHYVRPDTSNPSPQPFFGVPPIYTDEAGIIADGTVLNAVTTYEVATA